MKYYEQGSGSLTVWPASSRMLNGSRVLKECGSGEDPCSPLLGPAAVLQLTSIFHICVFQTKAECWYKLLAHRRKWLFVGSLMMFLFLFLMQSCFFFSHRFHFPACPHMSPVEKLSPKLPWWLTRPNRVLKDCICNESVQIMLPRSADCDCYCDLIQFISSVILKIITKSHIWSMATYCV